MVFLLFLKLIVINAFYKLVKLVFSNLVIGVQEFWKLTTFDVPIQML